jgi:hypothetical protein
MSLRLFRLIVAVVGLALVLGLVYIFIYPGWFWNHWTIPHCWAYLFGVLPFCLIAFQGFYVLTFRVYEPSAELGAGPRGDGDALDAAAPGADVHDADADRAEARREDARREDAHRADAGRATVRAQNIRLEARRQATIDIGQQFGLYLISLDYFVPAGFALIAGLVDAYLLTHSELFLELGLGEGIVEGVIYGALGAYVYVLLNLGYRTFQRDISPGAAVWAGVQLFAGPILGGVVAASLQENVEPTTFTRVAVYFFAGLFPREIIAFIQGTVRRFFGTDTPLRKIVPLPQIRGITVEIEDRLFEEGIGDAYQLAMANPVRLQRNTPFDPRQILAWIDESLLYTALPDNVDALQKAGVSGAIDLAYYWTLSGGSPNHASIEILASRLGMAKELLLDVVRRLNEDAQVQMIWVLYQFLDEGT